MLIVRYDDRLGVIRTLSKGYSTPEQQADYVAQWPELAARARQSAGGLLHLVDSTQGVVQSKFASDQLAVRVAREGNVPDRTAIVLKSHVSNMRMASPSEKGEIRFFDDMNEAAAWLLALRSGTKP